nr:sulfur carrier protein ThiS [uncultured Peptostreptococcus sp.]
MAVINGEKKCLQDTSLLEYLDSQKYDINRIAIEVNGLIIKRDSYGDYIINESDEVEIVCFVGGG